MLIYVHRCADIRICCGLQVKRMTDEQRLLLARMIVALGDRDDDETRKLFVDMGFRYLTFQLRVMIL